MFLILFFNCILFGRWVILGETLSLVCQRGAACSHKQVKEQNISGCYSIGTCSHLLDLMACAGSVEQQRHKWLWYFKLKKGLDCVWDSSGKLQLLSSR